MPETLEAPSAPAQDTSRQPTLLETLAATGADLMENPRITSTKLPPIATDPDAKEKPKETKPVEAKVEKKAEAPAPKEEESGEPKQTPEQLQKSAETISDKLFPKRKKSSDTSVKLGEKQADSTDGAGDTEVTPAADAVKPAGDKPKKEKQEPVVRRQTTHQIDEIALTERAASAAAKAVSDSMAKTAAKPEDKLEKGPEADLTPEERKQYVVYKELEELDPNRYKGVTSKYIKSLAEIGDYVKTWSKENPGVKFNPDDKEHNVFFERVEPEVDEDDWVDAKASIRARDIAARAIAPVNERMQKMERDRARTALEPQVHSKQIEATHMLLEHFDPAVAEAIRKPDGLKELATKDPITVSILSSISDAVGHLAAEVVRLHDPLGGVEYSASNPAHQEIADFIIGQEKRISSLPPEDRERDGKQFLSRLQFQNLSGDQKSRYWFLNQDDVINLLAQKYALRAKNLRDSKIEEFNKTAESMGFKKLDVPKETPKPAESKPKETPKQKDATPSPEATSRASTKPTPGSASPNQASPESAIVGALFSRYKSA